MAKNEAEHPIDLLRHPVRVQILAAVGGGKDTPKEIAASLPEIPVATLYRHINSLLEGGALYVREMRPTGAQKERVLAINEHRTMLNQADFTGISKQDLLAMLAALLSGVEVSFQRYTNSHDRFSPGDFAMIMKPVYMSDADYAEFRSSMLTLLEKHAAPRSDADRLRNLGLFAVIE